MQCQLQIRPNLIETSYNRSASRVRSILCHLQWRSCYWLEVRTLLLYPDKSSLTKSKIQRGKTYPWRSVFRKVTMDWSRMINTVLTILQLIKLILYYITLFFFWYGSTCKPKTNNTVIKYQRHAIGNAEKRRNSRGYSRSYAWNHQLDSESLFQSWS